MSNERTNERKIHVALPDDVHQCLRVKCALQDTTIQDYVAQLIALDVSDVQLPINKSSKRESIEMPLPQRERKSSKKSRLSKAS